MPPDSDFEIPAHLRWVPPAPDPDEKYKREAHRLRVTANAEAFLQGSPLTITPTWQAMKAEAEAKAAAEAASSKATAELKAERETATAEVARLEAATAELKAKLADAEEIARIRKGVDAGVDIARMALERSKKGKKRK